MGCKIIINEGNLHNDTEIYFNSIKLGLLLQRGSHITESSVISEIFDTALPGLFSVIICLLPSQMLSVRSIQVLDYICN